MGWRVRYYVVSKSEELVDQRGTGLGNEEKSVGGRVRAFRPIHWRTDRSLWKNSVPPSMLYKYIFDHS